VIMGLVGMNLVIPRFFCRVLCPLGALPGLLSRVALLRRARRDDCTSCGRCEARCRMAGTVKS